MPRFVKSPGPGLLAEIRQWLDLPPTDTGRLPGVARSVVAPAEGGTRLLPPAAGPRLRALQAALAAFHQKLSAQQIQAVVAYSLTPKYLDGPLIRPPQEPTKPPLRNRNGSLGGGGRQTRFCRARRRYRARRARSLRRPYVTPPASSRLAPPSIGTPVGAPGAGPVEPGPCARADRLLSTDKLSASTVTANRFFIGKIKTGERKRAGPAAGAGPERIVTATPRAW